MRRSDASTAYWRILRASTVLLLSLLLANIILFNTKSGHRALWSEWLPKAAGPHEQAVEDQVWQRVKAPSSPVHDDHPIRRLMLDASLAFNKYDSQRSTTFKQTVTEYRKKHGRHPPPGFEHWYRFARQRSVYNIDDFDQIHDDLRPFWSIEPGTIRRFAAHAADNPDHGLAVVSVRNGRVCLDTEGWRPENFVRMLRKVSRWLPDMDIPINQLDQPRVIVPWEAMQQMLEAERQSRVVDQHAVVNRFTRGMSGLRNCAPWLKWFYRSNPFHRALGPVEDPADPAPDYKWFWHAGEQYMDTASKACPPESYARSKYSDERLKAAENLYKDDRGGFVKNFNRSSDLCTVGPQLSHLHGMLFAATSALSTAELIPVFSECKTSVNNDILFPANMYYMRDKRYKYVPDQDIDWEAKNDVMIWRGVTSGGTAHADQPERWREMHRQRLVSYTNATLLEGQTTTVLALRDDSRDAYETRAFSPATFAHQHTDVGFTEKIACLPNCDFYNDTFTMVEKMSFAQTFNSKYLVDVDGHSFSGRWRAFLQSNSLGIKATLFREWHDSRLFAWKHFVPMDNRYDDLYGLLTYFIGYPPAQGDDGTNEKVRVPRHDYEAYQIAIEGRKWAAKALRREDMETYLFRLLLEYGRVIDDNRNIIGNDGDGGSEMAEFDRKFPAMA